MPLTRQSSGFSTGPVLKILFDTHAFWWAVQDNPRLSRPAAEAFLDPHNEILVSIVSLWELVIKIQARKLPAPEPLAAFLAQQLRLNRITLLPVAFAHLARLEQLPWLHRDPFDRLLVAQCAEEQMPMATHDANIAAYDVRTIW